MTPSLICIHVDCAAIWRRAIEHTLAVLCDIIGMAHRFCDVDEAHVVYGRLDGASSGNAIVLARHPIVSLDADPRSLAPDVVLKLLGELLSVDSVPHGLDCVLLAYLCLGGAVERCFPRDAYGVPAFRHAPAPLARALARPHVNEAAAALERQLRLRFGPTLESVPRWPDGKHSVIVLTHDVDEPFSHRRAWYFLRRLRRCLAEGRYWVAARSAAAAIVAAAAEAAGRRPSAADDPNFGFESWMASERSLGCRSTFYVAMTDSATPGSSLEDVAYDATEAPFAAALRRCAESGWEVGLHASINARSSPGWIERETGALAALMGARGITGVRHHYWALDCDRPVDTWSSHAAAGLSYDSSLGMNDRVGFRRGIAWPFRPFDPDTGTAVDVVQVPPTLMDGAVVQSAEKIAERRTLIGDHLDLVAGVGGLAVLDWHLEQANPHRLDGIGPLLKDVLRSIAARTDIGWMTAAEVADWWRERHRKLAAARESAASPLPVTG